MAWKKPMKLSRAGRRPDRSSDESFWMRSDIWSMCSSIADLNSSMSRYEIEGCERFNNRFRILIFGSCSTQNLELGCYERTAFSLKPLWKIPLIIVGDNFQPKFNLSFHSSIFTINLIFLKKNYFYDISLIFKYYISCGVSLKKYQSTYAKWI